jgi:signal transduction histidine kinase
MHERAGGPRVPGALRRLDGGRVLALQVAAWAFLGFATTVVWALTAGDGDFYWPVWVWLGLGIPIAMHAAVRRAWRRPPGPSRRLAVQAAVSLVLIVTEVVLWALTGQGGTFWPVWSALGYSTLLALHWAFNQRLSPEREQALTARVDQLTRTRRGALDVQAAELRRIERDLHDGAQARLVALTMQLGRAEERMASQPEVAELFRRARGEASAAIAELRDLARGIAPPVLADRGLEAAVDALGRRAAIPVVVDAQMDERTLPVLETAAYFVVAEALTNVAKHAPQATARVTIRLDDRRLGVAVADDGPGGARADGGGLTGLRHRVEALDGTLTVTSPPGGGTVVRAELPCG